MKQKTLARNFFFVIQNSNLKSIIETKSWKTLLRNRSFQLDFWTIMFLIHPHSTIYKRKVLFSFLEMTQNLNRSITLFGHLQLFFRWFLQKVFLENNALHYYTFASRSCHNNETSLIAFDSRNAFNFIWTFSSRPFHER